jgi:hypothetical protein
MPRLPILPSLPVVLCGVGCTATALPTDDVDASTVGTNPAAVSGPGLEELCAEPEGPQVRPGSSAEAIARIVGVWVACNPSQPGEYGIEIASDGSFSQLTCDASSVLVRGRLGHWDLIDTSSMNGPGYYQLDLTFDGAGTMSTAPALSDTPRVMRLDRLDGQPTDHVPGQLGAPCQVIARPVPPPSADLTVDPGVASLCAAPAGHVVTILGAAAVRQRLLGRWMLCSAPSVFGTSDEVGIEFGPDGRFAKLYRDASGAVIAGRGFDRTGRAEFADVSSMNGAGAVQVNLVIDGDGTAITSPVFSDAPAAMRLSSIGAYEAGYVRVPQ